MDNCETWKPIVGTAGDYEVSSFGNVRSYRRRNGQGLKTEPHMLTPTPFGKHGYLIVTIRHGTKQVVKPVHRLVADAFLGPMPSGMVTRHLDGEMHNNSARNLAYGTVTENNQDKVRHGTSRPGEESPHAVMTNFGARVVRRSVQLGMRQTDVAKIFGVSKRVVNSIVRGHTYRVAA